MHCPNSSIHENISSTIEIKDQMKTGAQLIMTSLFQWDYAAYEYPLKSQHVSNWNKKVSAIYSDL